MGDNVQFLNAVIPNEFYYSLAAFEREQRQLFQASWYFVGLTTDLEQHNDFITSEIGGISVVVHNFKGELKAFHNVCTHRFNKIKSERTGNGPMACPYHNWNYNKDGIPFGIPLKKEFHSLDSETLKQLCLPQFEVECCGRFVFVRVVKNAGSLSSFLGEAWNKLQGISEMLGRKIEYHEIPNKANWKILVENTLEGYHIPSVHPDTFYKQGFNLKSVVDFEVYQDHSAMLLHLDEAAKDDKKRARFHQMLKDRPFQPDGFFHLVVFPNLSIGSLFGITAYIGSIRPISEKASVFAYELFETNLGQGQFLDEAVAEVVKYSSIEFTRTTLGEDREICENVQKGIEQARSAKGVLNSLEKRIWEFQKAYMKYMNEHTIA